MIRRYLDRAPRRAAYTRLEDGTWCAVVPGLRGVIATGAGFEACRESLQETVEEWVLVRIARGLPVPPLDRVRVAVRRTR